MSLVSRIDLPSDILEIIFRFLPRHLRLCSVSLVARRWRQAALRSVDSLAISKPDQAALLSLFPSLTHLKLRPMFPIGDLPPLRPPPSVTSLEIWDGHGQTVPPCILTLTCLTSISYSASASAKICRSTLLSLHAATLSTLCVTFTDLTEWTFTELAELSLPALTSLSYSIAWRPKVMFDRLMRQAEQGMQMAIASKASQLRSLTGPSDCIPGLMGCHFPCLTYLSLDKYVAFDSVDQWLSGLLSHLPALSHLALASKYEMEFQPQLLTLTSSVLTSLHTPALARLNPSFSIDVCSSLTSLYLPKSAPAPLNLASKLRTLHLDRPSSLNYLSACSSLTSLTLIVVLSDIPSDFPAHMSHLTKFTLVHPVPHGPYRRKGEDRLKLAFSDCASLALAVVAACSRLTYFATEDIHCSDDDGEVLPAFEEFLRVADEAGVCFVSCPLRHSAWESLQKKLRLRNIRFGCRQ